MHPCIRIFWVGLLFGVFGKGALALKPDVGTLPEDFSGRVEYVDGTPVDLSRLRGKPVLMYVGGDWCPPCIEKGRPTVMKMKAKYEALGLQIVFVSMDDNRWRDKKTEEARALDLRIAMPSKKTCPVGSCPMGTKDLGNFGWIQSFPSAFVFNAKGELVDKLDRGEPILRDLEGLVVKTLKNDRLL